MSKIETLIKKENRRQLKERWKKLKNPLIAIFGVILLFTCLRIVYQLSWGLFTALKSQNEFRENLFGPPRGFPWQWEWKNFVVVLKNFKVRVTTPGGQMFHVGIVEQAYNTIIWCITGAVTGVMVPCLVAYVTSTYEYKFNKVIYAIVIFSMILPLVGTGASQVLIFKALNIFDNLYLFNIVSQFNFLSSTFLIFTATFSGLSKTYREAGYIDGASDFKIMVKIMLPQATGMIFILMFLSFIGFWENWKTPNIYLPSYPTLSMGVFKLSQSTETVLNSITVKMAGALLLALPITILYLLNKSKIVGKISMVGGIKEWNLK